MRHGGLRDRAQAARTNILNTLLGIADDSPLALVRMRRAAAMEHTQGSYEALFGDEAATDVSRLERFATALRVAVLHEEPAFIDHFAKLLREDADGSEAVVGAVTVGPGAEGLASRLAAVLDHVELLVLDPAAATPANLEALQREGLTAAEVVTVSQLIAFTSYLVRVYVGLALLRGDERMAPACNLGPVSTRETGFTQEHLSWKPWIEPFTAEEATEEQRAVLPGQRLDSPTSVCLRSTLRLRERTATDRTSPEDVLPRADRELSEAVTSLVNAAFMRLGAQPLCLAVERRTEDVQRAWTTYESNSMTLASDHGLRGRARGYAAGGDAVAPGAPART